MTSTLPVNSKTRSRNIWVGLSLATFVSTVFVYSIYRMKQGSTITDQDIKKK